MTISKSLGSFNLFEDTNFKDEESSIELDLNSAIEKQKSEKVFFFSILIIKFRKICDIIKI